MRCGGQHFKQTNKRNGVIQEAEGQTDRPASDLIEGGSGWVGVVAAAWGGVDLAPPNSTNGDTLHAGLRCASPRRLVYVQVYSLPSCYDPSRPAAFWYDSHLRQLTCPSRGPVALHGPAPSLSACPAE